MYMFCAAVYSFSEYAPCHSYNITHRLGREGTSGVSDVAEYSDFLYIFQRNLGLLALIDEESRFPRASDRSLATKLHNAHSNDTSGIYRAPPDRGTTFGIMHYPGHVSAVSISCLF